MAKNNEVITVDEGTFSYNFKPAELTINNYDEIKKTITSVAKQYKNRVYQDDDLETLTEDHRMLNSLRNGLEEGRINVKKVIMEPYESFEKDVKGLVELIDEPLNDIKAGRDEILEAQKEVRHEALIDYIERQLKDSNVRIEDLEIQDSWKNKGNWTEKLNPRKKLTDEIKRHIEVVEEQHKNKIAQREVLEKFLEGKGMETEGWIEQLEYREATEIMDSIQKAEEKRKQEEQEKERIEQAEREADEQAEHELTYDETNEQFNDETEEVTQETFKKTFDEKITERIEVTGTQEQLNDLNNYMVANGITVAPITDVFDFEETLDDLPF